MKRYALKVVERHNAPPSYFTLIKGWLWGWNPLNRRQNLFLTREGALDAIKLDAANREEAREMKINFQVVKTSILEVTEITHPDL
ncbi:MAG: hypothetical protein Unbinned7794contig1000_25 [Prokaryotic dsDNA virus sp.]|nr:MAG: hypothetical protein Unbinned7794contig1000_25 [Prokaryotic dsDNA virus sp.]|tara:strand:+ start:7598 stop:7852 length:255 start_codon:yes stop_codon:yes gene_type:complete